MDRTTSNGYATNVSGQRIFADQNLVTGVDGTDVGAADVNAWQEELMGIIEGFGLTGNASNLKQAFAALQAVLNQASAAYATPGTYSWTCPPGVFSRRVRVWGAGGGGGGMGNADVGGGGGGSGGGYSEAVVTTVPGTAYTITVGAGGTLGAAGGNNGGAGGSSSFGTLISATGGAGGTGLASGAGIGAATAGAGVGGVLNIGGCFGQNGVLAGSAYLGGCGGGTHQTSHTWNAAAAGMPGNFPGGGGGGGVRNLAGGAGANGLVIIG